MQLRMSRIGLSEWPALRWRDGERQPMLDWVADELPIAMIFNDQPLAVMLATPTDLEDFALGFALGEGVVERADEYALVDRQLTDQGIALHGRIPGARFEALQSRRRTLASAGGCGLCGRETLQAALPQVPAVEAELILDGERIVAAIEQVTAAQAMNRQCGGMHAAALISPVDCVLREDIGRHNAVDKVVGALRGEPPPSSWLLVTSRASYEIVLKAARCRLPAVVAMSAPTSLAIELAERCGITLIAFARGRGLNVYSHPGRLQA